MEDENEIDKQVFQPLIDDYFFFDPRFIDEVKGRIIPWSRIKEQYRDYLPEYVADIILKQIRLDKADDKFQK